MFPEGDHCPVVQAATSSPDLAIAKVVHLKAIEQPCQTFFVSCLPPQQQQHLQVQITTEE
jgi:hypothetical protein